VSASFHLEASLLVRLQRQRTIASLGRLRFFNVQDLDSLEIELALQVLLLQRHTGWMSSRSSRSRTHRVVLVPKERVLLDCEPFLGPEQHRQVVDARGQRVAALPAQPTTWSALQHGKTKSNQITDWRKPHGQPRSQLPERDCWNKKPFFLASTVGKRLSKPGLQQPLKDAPTTKSSTSSGSSSVTLIRAAMHKSEKLTHSQQIFGFGAVEALFGRSSLCFPGFGAELEGLWG
jgi:hypothetical protein